MRAVAARSISRYLLATWPASAPLRVLSVHQRVLNLEEPGGDILALVHPQVGNGPFHVVLAEVLPFQQVHVGDRGMWEQGRIRLGDWWIAGDEAPAWAPQWPQSQPWTDAWQEAVQRCVQGFLATFPASDELDALTWDRIRAAKQRLEEGMRHGDLSRFREGVEMLVGLGPGLTPAGDDLLLGLWARWFLGGGVGRLSLNENLLGETILARTTRLSRVWLQHARAGRFAEPWHQVAQALQEEDEGALCHGLARIATIGATSGRMALWGFGGWSNLT